MKNLGNSKERASGGEGGGGLCMLKKREKEHQSKN